MDGEVQCSCPAEALLHQFYAWEKRGRGWQLYESHVRPEPAFEVFAGHFIPRHQSSDNGRRPTLLSRATQSLLGIFGASTPPAPEVVRVPPRQHLPREAPEQDWVQLQIQLPADAEPKIEDFEQLLVAIGGCRKPVCFELVGTGQRIHVQLAVDGEDVATVTGQLESYVPDAVITEAPKTLRNAWRDAYDDSVVVVDFGLSNEFMLPLATHREMSTDPYLAIVGALSVLQRGEAAALQILFEPVTHAWSQGAWRAITAPDGSAFFDDEPDFLKKSKEKIGKPLFAAVIRIAAASIDEDRTWQILRNLTAALHQYSDKTGNEFIPLSNDEYDDRDHLDDFLSRRSRRSGMILSSEELASLVHLPGQEVQHPKLERLSKKTKEAPSVVRGHSLLLGTNIHNGKSIPVSMSADQRVRHMHVIGASGTGKSTFLLNLILQDIKNGQGIGVIDPHGDLIDQIISHIPDSRLADVILVDPSDDQFPIGFNILSAHSDLEKSLLASDLVAVFKRFSTSWGDQMGSVLSNAVLAFLESTRGGTLADLRRFLIEPAYRMEFLTTVKDDHVLYYWRKEFPLLSGRPQAPLLTRLDTFLRPKPVRYMVSQQQNRLDFSQIMDTGKIFLAKLAQGAIGEENASLLGSLFVSKFHQLTLGRQSQAEQSRRHFWLYCDEFGGYVTASMAKLLSGARKFRLGLVLSHQELQQLHDDDVESSLISNAGTRICFRLGDSDSKTLAGGFSFIKAEDLRNLGTGEAIGRIGRSEDDFNLKTKMVAEVPTDVADQRRGEVIRRTREIYATRREVVETEIARGREESPTIPVPTKPLAVKNEIQPATEIIERSPAIENTNEVELVDVPPEPLPVQTSPAKPRKLKPQPPVVAPMGKGGKRHKYLQHMVTQCAQQRGWRATIEMPTGKGAESIDVVLERESRRIAVEISVTSTVELELGNLKKCLAAGFTEAIMLCDEAKTLNALKRDAPKAVGALPQGVRFMSPDEMFTDEQLLAESRLPEEQVVKGYKVKVHREQMGTMNSEAKRRVIAEVLARGMTRE
jgi:hypothetical protein